ncbi:MAG: hypothetical protein KAS49_02880 [Candidatus Cloacimonetes bacterium]|nr:hypothetical protein [Candidatus Cloacimonadota bacterium]
MKKLWLLLPIILISLIACDILNHDVYSSNGVETFFADFNAAFAEISLNEVDSVMAFYHEDYLNKADNKIEDKDTMRNFFSEFFKPNDPIYLEAVLVDYNRFHEIKWNLTVNDTLVFEMEDVVIASGDSYLFYGNQINPPVLDPNKPVVFAECFTSENCGNCPPAANLLHDIKNEYGGQFIYVEYCFSNEHTPFFWDFAEYYKSYTQPTTVIQGTDIVVGSSPDDLEEIEANHNSHSEDELQARINNLDFTISGDSLSGSLDIEFISEIPTEDLKLVVVFADEKPDIYYTGTTERFYNVAYRKVTIDITESVNKKIEFKLPNDVEVNKPKVIAWLRTKEDTHSANCKVYAAAEKRLSE